MMKKKKIIILTIAGIITIVIAFLFFMNKEGNRLEIINYSSETNENSAQIESFENLDSASENQGIQIVPDEAKLENLDEKKNEEKKDETKVESVSTKLNIKDKLIGWGYEKADGRKIDTIIVHSSYNSLGGDEYSVDKILDIYKSYGVAAHYIIDRKGNIYRLVEDKNIAYHAGESKVPDGRTAVNKFSIGIEMVNNKSDKCTSAQYAALKSFLSDLKSKYSIKYILGHKDIAPGRKDDPWNFDWGKVK